MDIDSVDFIESCAIKSEVILTETFSFCGKYEDCGSKELKPEPVDYEELLKPKEENDLVKYMDTYAAPMQQDFCSDSNFITIAENSPIDPLKVIKIIKYSCKKCNFTTQLEYSIKKHVQIHKSTVYSCEKCEYSTRRKSHFTAHSKTHTGAEYKCKKCDYKTVRKSDLMRHVKIHVGDEYKCK
ncbi:hypothetical protein FQA39_LY15111 [Lamprigera yunnana]|nr:hypothetical protein FQA39_LY15111 [Lamprigera yunnana]